VPGVCFAADAKSALDLNLSPEVGAAAASILDYALAFSVVKVDGAAMIRIARHSANGSVYEVDWAAFLNQFGMSLAATSTNAYALAYADALAASTDGQIKSQSYKGGIARATSLAVAGAGAFSAGMLDATASSSGGAGSLAFAGNLAYTKGANITESRHLLGFYGENFSFAKSQSEVGVSLEETAGVLTTAYSAACTGFLGLSCDTGLDVNSEEFQAASNAAAEAMAKAMSRTRVLAVLAGTYKAQKAKASVYDIVAVDGKAAINVQCGADVDLTVEATAVSQ
jgi:hypothetical protein